MGFELRDGQGALFINDDKQSDKQPDYRGQIMIDGVEYWVSGWKKKAQSGASYTSLAVQRKDESGGGNRGGGNRGGGQRSGGYSGRRGGGGQRSGYGGGQRGDYGRGGNGGSSRRQQSQRGEAYEGDDGDDTDFR